MNRDHQPERYKQHNNAKHHHNVQNPNSFAFAAAPVYHSFQSYGQVS